MIWTNGIPQNALDPPVRAVLREVQQLKGSCPFLYAFDGTRWHFVTDVLGRAPAGLLYDGVHQAPADTREWLVVSGAHLLPAGRAADPRLHRGALGDRLLRSRRALGRGPAGGRGDRLQREDGPAAVSPERGSSRSRARGRRRRGRRRPRPHGRDRRPRTALSWRLRADALPGHRRAPRPGALAAGGAARRGR